MKSISVAMKYRQGAFKKLKKINIFEKNEENNDVQKDTNLK